MTLTNACFGVCYKIKIMLLFSVTVFVGETSIWTDLKSFEVFLITSYRVALSKRRNFILSLMVSFGRCWPPELMLPHFASVMGTGLFLGLVLQQFLPPKCSFDRISSWRLRIKMASSRISLQHAIQSSTSSIRSTKSSFTFSILGRASLLVAGGVNSFEVG